MPVTGHTTCAWHHSSMFVSKHQYLSGPLASLVVQSKF